MRKKLFIAASVIIGVGVYIAYQHNSQIREVPQSVSGTDNPRVRDGEDESTGTVNRRLAEPEDVVISGITFEDMNDPRFLERISNSGSLDERFRLVTLASKVVNRELRASLIAALVFRDLSAEEVSSAIKLLDESFYPGEFRTEIIRFAINEVEDIGTDKLVILCRDLLTEKEINDLSFEIGYRLSFNEIQALADSGKNAEAIQNLVEVKGVLNAQSIVSMSPQEQKVILIENIQNLRTANFDDKSSTEYLNGVSKGAPFSAFDVGTELVEGFTVSSDLGKEIVKNMARQNPNKTLGILKEGGDLNSGATAELFKIWTSESVSDAAKGFESVKKSLNEVVKDEVIGSFSDFALENGDQSGAVEWAKSIENELLRQKFLDKIEKGDIGSE